MRGKNIMRLIALQIALLGSSAVFADTFVVIPAGTLKEILKPKVEAEKQFDILTGKMNSKGKPSKAGVILTRQMLEDDGYSLTTDPYDSKNQLVMKNGAKVEYISFYKDTKFMEPHVSAPASQFGKFGLYYTSFYGPNKEYSINLNLSDLPYGITFEQFKDRVLAALKAAHLSIKNGHIWDDVRNIDTGIVFDDYLNEVWTAAQKNQGQAGANHSNSSNPGQSGRNPSGGGSEFAPQYANPSQSGSNTGGGSASIPSVAPQGGYTYEQLKAMFGPGGRGLPAAAGSNGGGNNGGGNRVGGFIYGSNGGGSGGGNYQVGDLTPDSIQALINYLKGQPNTPENAALIAKLQAMLDNAKAGRDMGTLSPADANLLLSILGGANPNDPQLAKLLSILQAIYGSGNGAGNGTGNGNGNGNGGGGGSFNAGGFGNISFASFGNLTPEQFLAMVAGGQVPGSGNGNGGGSGIGFRIGQSTPLDMNKLLRILLDARLSEADANKIAAYIIANQGPGKSIDLDALKKMLADAKVTDANLAIILAALGLGNGVGSNQPGGGGGGGSISGNILVSGGSIYPILRRFGEFSGGDQMQTAEKEFEGVTISEDGKTATGKKSKKVWILLPNGKWAEKGDAKSILDTATGMTKVDGLRLSNESGTQKVVLDISPVSRTDPERAKKLGDALDLLQKVEK